MLAERMERIWHENWTEGMAKGMAKGKAEGRAEGKAEGKAEGWAEGITDLLLDEVKEGERTVESACLRIEKMQAEGRIPAEIAAAALKKLSQ